MKPPISKRYSPAAGGRSRASQADESLSSFFDQSADPLVLVDASLSIVDANPAGARWLRTTRERLKGKPVLEIELLAQLLTRASIPQRLKQESSPVVSEVSVDDAEGQALRCRVEAITLREGRTLLHLTDTTHARRAQAAARATEQLFRALSEAIPQVCWTMALPEERLLDISPSVERLFGYQPADFQREPELWADLVHPSERERLRAELRKGLAGGRPFEIAFTGLHRDHRDLRELVMHVIPVADASGWPDRCLVLIEDRAEWAALEKNLRLVQASLRQGLDAVASGVLVLLPTSKGVEIAQCNRRLVDLLKLDEPTRAGTPLNQAPKALRDVVLWGSDTSIANLVASDTVSDDLIELGDPQRVIHRFASPLRDEHGEVIGRVMTLEDMTASWSLQRRLTQAQKMESMGRLAGGVAHDFNNLLGAMMGFSTLLLEETPATDPRREPLEQIAAAAERASRLNAALLAFSRGARFERSPVSLNRVVEDSYHILRSTLEPSVSIVMQLEPELRMLLGDPVLLQQVLVNLTQLLSEELIEGGTLQLTTRGAEPTQLLGEVATDEIASSMVLLEIQVADSGLSEPPKAATRSTGLALTIVEDIVRAHGGYLERCTAGNGHGYRVALPIETVERRRALVPDPATAR